MQRKDNIKIIGTAILCICMTVITISFVEVLIRRDTEHEKALIHDTLLNTGALIGQEIQRNLSYGIVVTETLHALLESTHYQVTNFPKWGERLFALGSGVSAIQLAPNGVVSYIYPLKGNERALGHDLLLDKNRDDGAKRAIQSRDVTFVGPIKLIQNDKYAVVARKPVFREVDGVEKFWGFTIAFLMVESVLPDRVRQLEKQGLYIKLEGEDPDSQEPAVLFSSEKWIDGNDVAMTIKVPNGTWTLRLGHDPITNKYYSLGRIFAAFFSIGIAICIFVQQCMMSVKQEEISFLNEQLMELSLKDELTGIGNRRAGMQALERGIQKSKYTNKTLSVLMLDIDLFKEVNDQYGHPAGDHLLKHSAFCINASAQQCNSVFRIGGDEFLMHLPEKGLDECVEVADAIQQFVEKMPCEYDGTELPMSFSIGLAEYHPDETIDSLLHRVDIKLYEAKNAGRNTIKY